MVRAGKPSKQAGKRGWRDFRKLLCGPELATLIRAERSLPAPHCPVSDRRLLPETVYKEQEKLFICVACLSPPGESPSPCPTESHGLFSHLMDERNLEA